MAGATHAGPHRQEAHAGPHRQEAHAGPHRQEARSLPGPGLLLKLRAYGTGTSTGPTTSMLSNLVFVRYCTTSMVAALGSPYSLKSSGPVTPS